jgi:hypothetical protein
MDGHLGTSSRTSSPLRLAAAELLVLQHCHEITPNLIDTMDKFAHDPRQPRSYMIFDGADTARVLKSQGLLPAGAVP